MKLKAIEDINDDDIESMAEKKERNTLRLGGSCMKYIWLDIYGNFCVTKY